MTSKALVAFVVLVLASGCSDGPRERPQAGALAGTYELAQESKEFLIKNKGYVNVPESQVILRQDGTVSVTRLPDCYVNGFGEGGGHFLSGEGRWEIEKTYSGYGVTLIINEGGTLKAGIYHGSSIQIWKKMPPFDLAFGLGDPDQNEFITYQKNSS